MGKEKKMFDYALGNPPYNADFSASGDNGNFAQPVYNDFMDAAIQVAEKVELIHPARFLFNAGSTPKSWNEKMLNDPHFTVLSYEEDATKIFPNTDIKGGVAITYHDNSRDFGAIHVFTKYTPLNSILKKAGPKSEIESIMSIIYIQNRFNLSALFKENPECRSKIGSNGKDPRFEKNIFVKVPLFTEKKENDSDIRVLGICKQKRSWRYLPMRYVDKNHENLEKYKVILPVANGNGAFGETLSSPLIEKPDEAYTRSFIGIGAFEDAQCAEAALRYIKGKFSRALLAILKVTQMTNKDVWRYVPIQDFTNQSDIDWTKSIHEIDLQLYRKYGLSAEEINFIETHVKEME